jgi:hypothetical protein
MSPVSDNMNATVVGDEYEELIFFKHFPDSKSECIYDFG